MTRLLAVALGLSLAASGCQSDSDLTPDAESTAEAPPGALGVAGKPSAEQASTPATREQSGRLETGDETLQTGEFVDVYTVDVEAGQTLVVDLRATDDLDPYLMLESPSEVRFEQDDFKGDRTRSHLEHAVTDGGTWRVMVTTYESGETGAYDVTITTQAEPPTENALPVEAEEDSAATNV